MRVKPSCRVVTFVFLCAVLGIGGACRGQAPKPTPSYPSHLPYSFSNFVWWSDEELGALLKKRVSGLGDEIATNNAAEGRVRDALTALLKEKGIVAEVQSEEPSTSALNPQDPDPPDFWDMKFPPTPRPHVEFRVAKPNILIGRVLLQSDSEPALQIIQPEMKSNEGKPFTFEDATFMRYRAEKVLKQNGFLSAEVREDHEAPRVGGQSVVVDLALRLVAGPKYTVSTLTADAGPLLAGRDLSPLFALKVGDAAGRDPFQRIESALQEHYRHAGYLEVRIENHPAMDREHGKVAYHLGVFPGPVYHLRQLVFRNLNPAQEAKVRELLGMKSGDVFNTGSVDDLPTKCGKEQLLAGQSVVTEVKKDVDDKAIDLIVESFN
jgi:hypothetical protein